jgi:hypothetical protein
VQNPTRRRDATKERSDRSNVYRRASCRRLARAHGSIEIPMHDADDDPG